MAKRESAFGDAVGYQGVYKRADANAKGRWRVAMRVGQGGAHVSRDLAFRSRSEKGETPRTEGVETLDDPIKSTCTHSGRPHAEIGNPVARGGSRYSDYR